MNESNVCPKCGECEMVRVDGRPACMSCFVNNNEYVFLQHQSAESPVSESSTCDRCGSVPGEGGLRWWGEDEPEAVCKACFVRLIEKSDEYQEGFKAGAASREAEADAANRKFRIASRVADELGDRLRAKNTDGGKENALLPTPPDPRACPRDLIEGLRRFVDHGLLPGHFLQAMLSNDLANAVRRADIFNARLLPDIIAFMDAALPAESWGSEEKMHRWVDEKLKGLHSHVEMEIVADIDTRHP